MSASATVASLLAEDSEFVSADLTALFGKMKVPYLRVRYKVTLMVIYIPV